MNCLRKSQNLDIPPTFDLRHEFHERLNALPDSFCDWDYMQVIRFKSAANLAVRRPTDFNILNFLSFYDDLPF